ELPVPPPSRPSANSPTPTSARTTTPATTSGTSDRGHAGRRRRVMKSPRPSVPGHPRPDLPWRSPVPSRRRGGDGDVACRSAAGPQMDEVYGRLRGRLEGLGDEEYFWEPV